jgi:hypothetical protein
MLQRIQTACECEERPGTFPTLSPFNARVPIGREKELQMHGLIYLIGVIVVIMAILSFFGLR